MNNDVHDTTRDPRQYRRGETGDPKTGLRPAFTCENLGLHPLTAFVMVAADSMLFGGEIASGFLLCVFSAFVGMALTIPCAVIQRRVHGDDRATAIAKALIVGLLTAIPTALPSFVTGIWGVVGAIGIAQRRAAERGGADNHDHDHYGEN